MAEAKIRAFLSSDVLLEYLKGKPELRDLFSDEVRERADFVTNGTTIVQLVNASRNRGRDVGKILPHVEIADIELLSPEMMERFREQIVTGEMHINDVMTLFRARLSDVLLTYDEKLRDAASTLAVRTETPEEFLQEVGRAA